MDAIKRARICWCKIPWFRKRGNKMYSVLWWKWSVRGMYLFTYIRLLKLQGNLNTIIKYFFYTYYVPRIRLWLLVKLERFYSLTTTIIVFVVYHAWFQTSYRWGNWSTGRLSTRLVCGRASFVIEASWLQIRFFPINTLL